MTRHLYALAIALALASPVLAAEPLDGPLSPEDAPRSFQLEPGLKIELVAAEPLVVAPVAMAFDENGRLFVAENRGYPNGAKDGESPLGRIALLEDTDGDGRMDKRQEFVTGLTFPNGVLPWDGGLIVTCAPDILFFKDTDGDGKADERKVLFTGFATTGSTQLRTSHPTLSLDGWVYVTSGLTGGKITCPAHPERPAVELKRTDFRFRPDLSEYEAADGGAQFGMSFDDFGRRFICYNRVQVQHVVIASQVLRRNPHLAFSETVENCPADLAPEPLAGHGRAARLYPISSNVTTADSHAGTFTAACGLHIFRGTGLRKPFRGAAFSCDPTGNLIHVDRLTANGATFQAVSLLDKRELLASTDNWFRPVFLSSGPDGSLYVCDMYRKTIEHPDYLPVEIRKHTDFESGRDKGRIWRIKRAEGLPATPSLRGASLETMLAGLQSSNGWTCDTAFRLLLARRDKDAVLPLKELLKSRGKTPPATALLALQLLDRMGELDRGTLEGALVNYGLPEMWHLVAPRLEQERNWFDGAVARDFDGRAVFPMLVAASAAPPDQKPRPATLAKLALGADDRWTRAALWCAVHGSEGPFAEAVLKDFASFRDHDLLRELGTMWILSQEKEQWPAAIRAAIAAPDDQLKNLSLIIGMGEGLRRRGVSPGEAGVLHASLPAEDQAAHEKLDALFAQAQKVVAATYGNPHQALALLAFGRPSGADTVLAQVLDSPKYDGVKRSAIRSLGGLGQGSRVLLQNDRFESLSPALREEALTIILAEPRSTASLLDALEAGKLPLASIDALRRRQLRDHRDPAIKARAAKLFEAVTGDRAKVYEELKGVAEMPGEAAKGKVAFAKHCATCHRLDREGFAVGPDLFGIRNQPKAAILLHILVPEQEITQGFTAYMAETKDGRVFVGLLAGETETSVTIRQPLGKEETILRANLERLAASPLSLMPQGIEKTLSRQDLADLLAYLKGEQ